MNKVYFDGAANTPLDTRACDAMKPFMSDKFAGNSFAIHDAGISAASAIDEAKETIIKMVDLPKEEYDLFFTSGATESNNWVIWNSILQAIINPLQEFYIICNSTEHDSILRPLKLYEEKILKNLHVKYLDFSKYNFYSLKEYVHDLYHNEANNNKILLMICMSENNETGYIYDMDQIAQVANSYNIPLLCDCTQWIGGGHTLGSLLHNPCLKIDFYTYSGHKIYGPTGIGALHARRGSITSPLIAGGAQNKGLRGGTENTAGIVGMARALEDNIGDKLEKHFEEIFTYFEEKVHNSAFKDKISYLQMQDKTHYAKNIISLKVDIPEPYILVDLLVAHGIECSAGSACDAQETLDSKPVPSHVLVSLGYSERDIEQTARLSFTKYTSKKDIDYLFEVLNNIIKL